MKLHRTMFFVVAFASATVAAQPDNQAPAEVTPAQAKSWIALFNKVVDAVVANRGDCTRMADGLNIVVETHPETIAMARDAKAKGICCIALGGKGARRMVGALDKCGRNEKVGAAFKRIDLGGRT